MGIKINNKGNIFSLETKATSYIFGIDNNGLVRQIYWGDKIKRIDDFFMIPLQEVSTNDPVFEITKEEYPVYGGLRYKEHCLKVTFADGNRDLNLIYLNYEINNESLFIKLKDKYYDFYVTLIYTVNYDFDLIERSVEVENLEDKAINIEKIYTAALNINKENLIFSNVRGHWGAEFQQFKQRVSYGKIYIENRRGISSHNHNPYFILDNNANENSGEVYFGALKTAGNFIGIVEQSQYGGTTMIMGLNSHDFNLKLNMGEKFRTPVLLFGYSNLGFSKMSNNIHRFAKENILKKPLKMVLYNSWEATEFNVTAKEQIKLAKRAKEIGAELFVVDDGWFGERNSINNGLGDWYVNKEKFPKGLKELIDEVKSLDMKFGIWVEPEMVNPLSMLYKNKPEWIYQFKNRETDRSRGQYVLNLCRDDVKEYIFNELDRLLSENDIDYIKWDANRPISQSDIDKSIWQKHIESLYDIVKRLKEKHKNVLFEACASGGGRIDYGTLEIFDDFWTSDNTDALDRLTIQESYSYIYPIKAMRAWVTDCPNFLSKRNIPLRFRFHSAMMGTLGIGSNILNLSDSEIMDYKKYIDEYKDIRDIIQNGDFYRVFRISNRDYSCYQYNKDREGVLFVFLPQSKIGHSGTTIKFEGLNKDLIYKVKINDKVIEKSGEYLMYYGIFLVLDGDYASEIIRFQEI